MEDVTFRVVEIDGVLADIRPVFNGLATAVLDRPVEVPEGVEPPHTISRLSIEAGLSAEEQDLVRATIYELRDFWVSVSATVDVLSPAGEELCRQALQMAETGRRGVFFVYHARRLQTRGKPVLLQTVEWLTKHGYKNPIVWIEEEG